MSDFFIKPLRKTFAKAYRSVAETATRELPAVPNAEELRIRRNEIDFVRQVICPLKNDSGMWTDSVIFEFTEKQGKRLIRYDDRFLKIT